MQPGERVSEPPLSKPRGKGQRGAGVAAGKALPFLGPRLMLRS